MVCISDFYSDLYAGTVLKSEFPVRNVRVCGKST
jgi:hypothetical protein